VLSQRWPRKAPYTWVPWKFSGLPDYAHGYYSQHFSWAFVPIDPVNVPTKFEVRSFTRFWDNRKYPKNLSSSSIRPRSIFSQIFNGRIFGLALNMNPPNLKSVRLPVPEIRRVAKLQTPISRKGRPWGFGERGWYGSEERWWVPIGPP